MAALIKHVLSKVPVINSKRFVSGRVRLWRPPPPIPKGPKILGIKTCIADRGFLRPVKEYTPPKDVGERLQQLFTKIYGTQVSADKKITTPQERFSLLNECFKAFNYGVPNSLLSKMLTVGDVQTFYESAVDTTTPLNTMKKVELPPNLHVQYEPIRFHPETDTMFGGQTAFPKNPTLVTGIRTKKKYKSYIIPDSTT